MKIFIKVFLIFLILFICLNLYTDWDFGRGQGICKKIGNKQNFYHILNKLEQKENNITLGRILYMYTTFCDGMIESDTLRVLNLMEKMKK